jgi:hypothetical protein
MSDARAIGYLELNISGFQEAITSAKRALGGLAVTFTAFKTAQFFTRQIDDAVKFGDALYHASQRAGHFKPETFFVIQKALQNAGLGAEEARSKIDDFVTSGKRLDSIFGGQKQYGEALRNAAAEYGREAKVFGDNAARFSKVFEMLQAVGEKMRTFFGVMTAQFLKPMQALLETIQKVDLSGTAAKFGDKIAYAINLLNGFILTGGFGEALGLSVQIGFMTATNWLVKAVMVALQTFATGIDLIFSNQKFLNGFSDSLVAIAGIFGVAMLKAMQGVLSFIQGSMDYIFARQEGDNEKANTAVSTIQGALVGFVAGNLPGAVVGAGLGYADAKVANAQNQAETPEQKKAREEATQQRADEAFIHGGPKAAAAVFKQADQDFKDAHKTLGEFVKERNDKGVEFSYGGKPMTLNDALAIQKGNLADAARRTATSAPTLGADLVSAFKLAMAEAKKNGDIFDTSELLDKLTELIAKAAHAGEAAANAAKPKLTDPSSVQLEKPGPFKIIADSLAKIGGGGGYIRVSQSIHERMLMQNTRAIEANTAAQNAANGKNTPPPVSLGMAH